MLFGCCREAVAGLDRQKCSNPGLLLARYLRVPVSQEGDSHVRERKQLFDNAIAALKRPELTTVYRQAFLRRCRWIKTSASPTVTGLFETKGRLIIGLGVENVLETGLTLEHTFGVPIIPGSALKGLASHYCVQVWGERDPGFRKPLSSRTEKKDGEYARIIFGNTTDAGFITFHDAWLDPNCTSGPKHGIKLDVMTPHHGNYYASGDSAPTDFDDPNPILFLSITGQFHVTLSCEDRSEAGAKWAKLAFEITKEALENWGIGGKTASGYGRMKLITPSPDFTGDSNAPSQSASSGIRAIDVTMTGVNKKGNQQFRSKEGNIRCFFQPGEKPYPEIQKGETRSFWLIEERQGEGYLISQEKPK